MKKILLFLLFFIIPWNISWASFLNNNPNYIKIDASMKDNTYIEKNTPESIRYEPPYYVIKGKIFSENFELQAIGSITVLFYYNDEKKEAYYKPIGFSTYSSDGKLLQYTDKDEVMNKIEPGTIVESIADLYFLICYQKCFFPIY